MDDDVTDMDRSLDLDGINLFHDFEDEFLWKSKAYPIGTGQKIAYLFPAQSTKKNANQ